MTLLESISDFAELYLSIDLPRKEIDLIKNRSFSKESSKDPLRQTVVSFRKLVKIARNHFRKIRSKTHYSLPEKWERFLHRSPEEFLLIIGQIRYGLSEEILSLILNQPIETVGFKIKNIHEELKLNEDEIKNLHHHLKPLEQKRYSQIQSFKSKFRPQRFLIESGFVMFSILFLAWSIPSLKLRYDNWIEKKTEEYFVEESMQDAPVPEELKNEPKIISEERKEGLKEETQTNIKTERRQPKVYSGEVWRFSFNGSSKAELDKEILKILKNYSDQAIKPSIAPGGIQYDALVKVEELVSLKMKLEELSDSEPQNLKMSWYKKKNMGNRKIPDAHVEVVIWISTI